MNIILLIIVIGIFPTSGIFVLWWGRKEYHKTRHFLKTAIITHGTVLDIGGHSIVPANRLYQNKVHFYTTSERKIEFTSKLLTSAKPKYDVGSEIEIIYDPEHPEDAEVKSFFALWLSTIISFLIGISFTLVGLLLYVLFFLGKIKQSR